MSLVHKRKSNTRKQLLQELVKMMLARKLLLKQIESSTINKESLECWQNKQKKKVSLLPGVVNGCNLSIHPCLPLTKDLTMGREFTDLTGQAMLTTDSIYTLTTLKLRRLMNQSQNLRKLKFKLFKLLRQSLFRNQQHKPKLMIAL